MFTVVGEILMDFTPLARRGALAFQARAGGSAANVAVGLARLGARVDFAGKVSTDAFGRYLRRHLERERVGTRFVSRSPDPSALAFVSGDPDDPSFALYAAGTADAQLSTEDLPSAVDRSVVLHFGSISLVASPSADTVLGLVDRLRGRCLLSLDPNVRPRLVRDVRAYRRTLKAACRAADILKMSSDDLAWLAPKTRLKRAAAQLLALGPALVVITLGPRGCYARTPAHEWRVQAPHVDVVDSVGAGDAFSAGLLARLGQLDLISRAAVERASAPAIRDILRYATVAAALTCTRRGADPPRQNEVDRFLRPEPR